MPLASSLSTKVEEKMDFEKRVAYLEFVNDQLESEIGYVDALLRTAGFTDGLNTLKAVAQEVIDEESL